MLWVGAELLDDAEDGAVVLLGVEFVAVEAVCAGEGLRGSGGGDRTVVDPECPVMGLAAGGGAEDPLQRGERGIGDVPDTSDPEAVQGSGGRGADAGAPGGRPGSQERRLEDAVRHARATV